MTSIASFEQTSLLELRTGTGAIYLCPSRLERIRLQWTFRHFHVLPPQLLSRHDQRLIQKLSQSAVVTPPLPVASDAILGVIEQVNASSTMHADTLEPAAAVTLPFDQSSRSAARWGLLGGVAAIALVVAAILMPGHPKRPRASAQIMEPLSATPTAGAGSASVQAVSSLVAVAPAAVTPALKPRHTLAQTPHAEVAAQPATPLAAVAVIEPADRRIITELPPGHFAHPSVMPRNLVGEVQLKALIDPDGSVKQVTVLSGDPRLAEAGMRAVRQWHYSPFAPQATQMEEESQIKMNFFGPDAVSIASVASRP